MRIRNKEGLKKVLAVARKHGLNDSQLAERLSVSPSLVSYWRSGERNFTEKAALSALALWPKELGEDFLTSLLAEIESNKLDRSY